MRTPGILMSGVVTVMIANAPVHAGVHSATLCSANNTEAGSISYSQLGLTNLSTGIRTVICGGVTDGTATSLSLTVYDRDPVNNVVCTVFLSTADGATLFTTSLSSSGFASDAMTLSTALPGVAGVLVLQCMIPPRNTSNGMSHLVTYEISDSE